MRTHARLSVNGRRYPYPDVGSSGVELDDGVYAVLEPGMQADWDILGFVAAKRTTASDLVEYVASYNKNFSVPFGLSGPSSWAGSLASDVARYPLELGDVAAAHPYEAFENAGIKTDSMRVWKAQSTYKNVIPIQNAAALPSNVSRVERWDLVNNQDELVALGYFWMSASNKKFNLCVFSTLDGGSLPVAKVPLTIGQRGTTVRLASVALLANTYTINDAATQAAATFGAGTSLALGQTYASAAATEITGNFDSNYPW